MRSFLLASMAFAFQAIVVFAQPKKVTISKPGSWIEGVGFDAAAIPDDSEASGVYYLLIDEQENTAIQEAYYHYAYRILTTEGLQKMSDLSFDFDPAFENLILHEVRIIREGMVINQLSKNIRTIQREQSMDRFLYDGTLTAIVNLNDVRTNDIIEYSFTRKGYNPVYNGHINRRIYFDYGFAFEKGFKRIILPANKEIELRFHPTETIFTKETGTHGTAYTWKLGQTKAVISENGLPYWHEYNRFVSISDFKSWAEVSDWANRLFIVADHDQAKINAVAQETFAASEPASYALEAVRFVQDEIRYLGFESGLNSHKPHAPLKVFEQRFGDCKDKSLLLVTLLRAKGIEAYPVLVHTGFREKISGNLPGANAFNHCVVKLELNGQSVFVDPTIGNQGGSIDRISFPNYRMGLVIRPDSNELEIFPDVQASSVSEEQTLEIGSIGGEAVLTVRTTYTGSEADYQRAEFSGNNLQVISKTYQDYYANLYSDITKLEDIKFQDNRSENVVTVEEKYMIPTFWKPVPGQNGIIYAELYPQTIEAYFNIDKTASRTSPYALRYPLTFHHTIHVQLPEAWNITPVDDIIVSEFYEYEYTVKQFNRSITLNRFYKTKSDHIPAEYYSKFVADHEKMMNDLSYQLTYNQDVASAANSKIPGIILTIVTIAASVFAVFAIYHRFDPTPHDAYAAGTPIGGWLILVGIGVTLSPLRLLVDLVREPDLITGAGWMGWLAAERYGLFTFTIITHIYNIFSLFFATLLAILFFKRRSSFPLLLIIQLALTVIVVTADTMLSRMIVESPDTISMKSIVQAVVAAAIWIPYMMMSERVKDTFINRIDNDDSDHYQSSTNDLALEQAK